MRESIKMEELDGFLNHSLRIERTNIVPLRLISNLSNAIAIKHLLKAVDLEEDNNFGLRYKYHAKIWKYLNRPYEKWGTYYRIDQEWLKSFKLDLSNAAWNDYDSYGMAYWYYDWNEDPETGDAWRLIDSKK